MRYQPPPLSVALHLIAAVIALGALIMALRVYWSLQ
jgi:hypothetical protein